ncbi:MAG: phytanoyl-CoA dioxygenase family protein [Pseudomonadota bacterium]
MSDLDALTVHGDTTVGWDATTPVNERVDENGTPMPIDADFGVADPRAPGRRVHDDPEVEALRDHLRKHNGFPHLEICSPDEVDRAVHIFRRDGFVVVRDLLDAEHLAQFRDGCERHLKDLLSHPGVDGRKYAAETGRLAHRYCYGTTSASRQMMHDRAWVDMIDLPTTTPIVTAIFGSEDYLVWGGGGDLSIPGAVEYQHLHTDGIDAQDNGDVRLQYLRELGEDVPDGAFADLDFRTQRWVMDRTNPGVTINFVMTDLTWENGPIRQIPGTHTATEKPPTLETEPEWMRLSTLVGAPAGSGIIRDSRAWHGATPNLSREIRALPSIEYAAGWRGGSGFRQTMPYEIWQSLSPHAQHICRYIKEAPGVWPHGAGVMHPLAIERQRAFEESAGKSGNVRSVLTDPSSAGTALRLFNEKVVDDY